PFHYRNKGDMATIGRYKAIANFGHGVHVAGYLAWWFWLFLHILYLAGFRNRLSVLLEWGYAYFTYGRGARLITDRAGGGGRGVRGVGGGGGGRLSGGGGGGGGRKRGGGGGGGGGVEEASGERQAASGGPPKSDVRNL